MESILLQYSYWAILPLAVVEGPIVTIIASFFASLGHLNIFYVYLLALAGDILGDIIHYGVGKYGTTNLLNKVGNKVGITAEKLEQARISHFSDSSSLWKIITLSKITHAPSSLIMITAGMLRIDFKQYLFITTINNIFKVFVFVGIGYFFGESYLLIGDYIEHSWVILLPIFVGITYLIYGTKK